VPDDAAADRLEAFLARLDRLGLEDLRLLALPLPDPTERAALLTEVERVAAEAQRAELLEEGRLRSREAMFRAYNRHQYDPTWAGLNWGRSLGTARDRLGLVLAAEDAAVAAVLSDLLDEDTVITLTEPFQHAAGMAGSTTTPSLSLGRPGPVGWLARVVYGLMLVVMAVTIGVVAAALTFVSSILLGSRRGEPANRKR
jgi:hypothetical protein